ncbi:MAG: DUF2851 family protein [Chthoniobacteraceae bacterium]
MDLADRYAQWKEEGFVSEAATLRAPRELPEVELQTLWLAGEFGREFLSTTRAPLRIERFGRWNAGSGPHFIDAEITFGSTRVRGSVVVHASAEAWEAEAAASPEYEGTILHVFASHPAHERGQLLPASCTRLGREVPQLWLDTIHFEYPPAEPTNSESTACRGLLSEMPPGQVEELIEAAAQFRLCKKAARLKRLGEIFGPSEALYQSVAEALGYRNNKLPFNLLAQRFPLSLLEAERGEIEPILFAGSGFLGLTDFQPLPGDTRSYLRDVWARWWPRRTEFDRLTVPACLWNFRGVRPVNHPQRRVAALAEIVRHWPVLEALVGSGNIAGVRHFFSQLSEPYWDWHYTLKSPRTRAPMALVGENRVTDLLLNVFFPRALAAAPDFWETYREFPATASNRRVDLAALRLFGAGPLIKRLTRRAVAQQGLLQLYEDFCLACEGDCARCPLPLRLGKWVDSREQLS